MPHAVACRALGISPAWFYKWRHGDGSVRRARRAALRALVAALFRDHHGSYGSPRITADLRELGWRVSVNTVAALMADQHLVARPKRRRRGTTRPGRGRWRAPDLVGRDFAAAGLNQRWFADGTEIDTDEGKLYLASVLDACSRRAVGFALGEHHDAELAYSSLAMAVAVRGGQVAGVVLHSDGGSEYTAGRFRAACARLGIRQSMGRPGSALDNAVVEAFHSTLEFELRSREHFPTKADARRRVAAWIDEYNRERRHSALGMTSPVAFELARRPTPPGSPVPGAESLAPSSPASRPPSAPCRAAPPARALTPAAGGAGQKPAGTAPRNGPDTKIRLTEVSTVSGD